MPAFTSTRSRQVALAGHVTVVGVKASANGGAKERSSAVVLMCVFLRVRSSACCSCASAVAGHKCRTTVPIKIINRQRVVHCMGVLDGSGMPGVLRRHGAGDREHRDDTETRSRAHRPNK